MKHLFFIWVVVAGILVSSAQNVIDNFYVGPYIVDYYGPGDVRFRLLDSLNLYEFYNLKIDTIITSKENVEPVKHAVQISGRVGANRFASKEIGLDGLWKQNISKNLYFNGGVSLAVDHSDAGCNGLKRDMFEVGVPLQLELGKLNHQYASLYGLFGIAPTYYSTMSASKWDFSNQNSIDDIKKSGFLVVPSLEFGGNIPVGDVIMRIGVYGIYKINCTPADYDVYKNIAGRMFLGAKIGVIL